MLETIATILIGTGFFLFGMEIIESKLKHIAGRRLKDMMGKWTSNRLSSWFIGFISGVITHSGSNATLIMTNLVSSHLLTPLQAYPILAAANIGTVIIVFLFAINLKLGIMMLLGTTAILYSLSKNARKTPYIGILLGISLTLYGFTNLEVGAEHLIENDTVHHFFESMEHSLIFYVVILLFGIGLRLITQSSSTVTILTITLTGTGLLTYDEALLAVVGAPIGASIAMYFESNAIKGIPKQVPMYQIAFEVCGSILLLILLAIEALSSIPIVKGLITGVFNHPTEQLAFTLLYIRVIPFILFSIFTRQIAAKLSLLSPLVTEDILSAPKYLFDQALEDPETALELVSKEQLRLFNRFTEYVENIREEHDIEEFSDYKLLHTTSTELGEEIARFIKEMFDENLERSSLEKLQKLQSIQDITMLLENSIYHIVDEVNSNDFDEEIMYLKDNIIESLHAILFISSSGADSDLTNVISMTSDKGNLLETIREKYLSKLTDNSSHSKKTIIYVTDLYGRIVWLLNKWAMLKQH